MTDVPEITGLDADGPRVPEYTLAVANAFAYAARVLNHLTLSSTSGSLEYISHADRLAGDVAAVAYALPQLLGQLTTFVTSFGPETLYVDDRVTDPAVAIDRAGEALRRAATLAEQLGETLNAARRDLNTIGHLDAGDDEDLVDHSREA